MMTLVSTMTSLVETTTHE